MKINTRRAVFTHEGGKAVEVNPYERLKRTVMACLLFEDNFYEDGKTVVDRIKELCTQVTCEQVLDLARTAANKYHLRHVPLQLIVEALKHEKKHYLFHDCIDSIITRPDQMCDLLSLYWKDGKKPIAHQLKKGLAKAFGKFDAYQLAKYNRDNPIKLRDIAFLCHVKAGNSQEKGKLYADLVNKSFYPEKTKSGFCVKETYNLEGEPKLAAPDTWEVRLSGGEDKKEAFNELLSKGKLGKLAILRNLRNMKDAGIPKEAVAHELTRNPKEMLPFQYLAAAKECPEWEDIVDKAMIQASALKPKLLGKTIIFVDVSGSMSGTLSGKSKLNRMDAACGLAILLRECVEQGGIYTFSDECKQVPNRQGMALRDAIINSQMHSGTYIAGGLSALDLDGNNKHGIDRVIVITDEQIADSIPRMATKKNYILNIAHCQNGIGSKNQWVTINGFSEASIDFIRELESYSEKQL